MPRVSTYCRVSIFEQTAENQRREIEAAGFTAKPQRLIEEQISDSVAASERLGFTRLLDRMENGDVLIAIKLDCLSRDVMNVQKTVERLATSDIRVHYLALSGTGLTSAADKTTMQVILMVTELEKNLLIERIHSGPVRVRVAGKRFGRLPALNQEQWQVTLGHLKAGAGINAVTREFGTSRQTIVRLRDDAVSPELPE